MFHDTYNKGYIDRLLHQNYPDLKVKMKTAQESVRFTHMHTFICVIIEIQTSEPNGHETFNYYNVDSTKNSR